MDCGTLITGAGACLPPRVVTSAEIGERIGIGRFGLPSGWIEHVTGVRERRWADPDTPPSQLAVRAARDALEVSGVEPATLDAIVFAGITRDFLEPATANVLQAELHARRARVFDLSNACNGFIDAIDVADSLVRSGKARQVLVATGERATLAINWRPRTRDELMRSVAGFVVGDGGGAVVVEATDDPVRGIRARDHRSDGASWPLAVGGRVRAAAEACEMCGSRLDERFLCDGRPLFEAVMHLLPLAMQAAVERSGWTYDDLDLVFCHEASRRFMQTGMAALGDGEHPGPRLWSTIERYGNTSTVSLPLAMAEAQAAGVLVRGARVLLLAGAAGVSAAAMTVVW